MARATLIILLVGLLGWCVVDAAPAETQLTDFARHARFRDIKISPEGDYVAASAVVDGKAVLSLIHLADMKGVNLRPRDDDEIADFWWVDARRVVYSISQKTEGLEQPLPTGELFAVNADGGSERMLVGFRDKGEPLFAFPVEPVFSSNGRMLVSLFRWNGSRDGAYPVASWLDVDSGRTIPVVTAPIRSARFVADNEGRVRFAYAQDVDQNQRVYYRDGEKGDWSVVFDEKRGDPDRKSVV